LDLEMRSQAAAAPDDAARGTDAHYLAVIGQRVASLGGQFHSATLPAGGTSITAHFPLGRVLLPES
jgi:hypothetical protein